MLSRLTRAQIEVSQRIEEFDFSHAALRLYDFIYGELCDWYLELVKPRLRAGEPELAGTLLHVLTETIALAHPLIPFETEEIYSHIPGAEGLLAARVSAAARRRRHRRRGRGDGAAGDRRGAGPAPLARPGEGRGGRDAARPAGRRRLRGDGRARRAARPDHIRRRRRRRRPRLPPCRSPAARWRSSPAPTSIREASAQRIEAQRDELRAEIARAEKKLSNQGFVAKAPPPVVAAERDKLERLRGELDAL